MRIPSTLIRLGRMMAFPLVPVALSSVGVHAQQVLDNANLDGAAKSAIVVRSTTTTPQLQAGRYNSATTTFDFTTLTDPGVNYRLLGATRLNAGAKTDLLFQNIATGDFGEARTWLDFDNSTDRLLRNVKRVWDVQAVGDLDGDGFGDLVWRYMADDPRDTGVSFIWFTNGAANAGATVQNPSNILQVRKRGGAPLTWTLLGARDINGDGAADMVYISPEGNIRVLMATDDPVSGTKRTCANLSAGTVPTGFTPLKFGIFSGDGRGDILYRNSVTGAVRLSKLDASSLTLPAYAGVADDPIATCTASSLAVTNTVTVYTTTTDPTWTLYAVGDYDGNGTMDMVWLRPNGQLTLWLTSNAFAEPTVIANAGTAPFTNAATESGILTDAKIAGVAYSTSSGVSGVTDANGKYRYNVGDTVTFSLGTLTLGSATANGVVSPVQLANGNSNKLTNLLVLLQSLDSGGNPGNGLVITTATAAAMSNAIDLTMTPATFASSANTALQSAMTTAGLTGSIKTVDQANTHFSSQAFTQLAGNVYGGVDSSSGLFVRIAANGEYLQGQAGPDVFSGNTKIETAGVEYGFATVLSFDTNGYNLKGTPSVDTNLTAGLSNPQASDRIMPLGNSVRTADGSTIPKVENVAGSIVGAWALGSATTIKTQTVIFGSNGKFFHINPTNGGPGSPPGVEFGSYTYNTSTKILKVSNGTYDTDGGNGFLQSAAALPAGMSFTLNADGITATLIDTTSTPQQVFTAYRISK